ncbi:hypothetical protein TIFTF001_000019 [Ficus carica]|uniref:Uncharacterized protein n=1 Tax=Ficus carica TaxID=3494 RepID=A0AA87YU58_FICCA|nr:hypothetical protein TIFTF001_000019 [Ficus carica]
MIYLSRSTVAISTRLRASVTTSSESRYLHEICRDLLLNCDLLGEIRHDLEFEDHDADEISVHTAILIPASVPSLFLY